MSLLKKKTTPTVLLQITPYSIKISLLIRCLSWFDMNIESPIVWTWVFFLTNYLRLIFYFSKKEKNNILKHFFYEKIVPILFFFYKKSKLTKKIQFSNNKNLTFFDLISPFVTFCDLLWPHMLFLYFIYKKRRLVNLLNFFWYNPYFLSYAHIYFLAQIMTKFFFNQKKILRKNYILKYQKSPKKNF